MRRYDSTMAVSPRPKVTAEDWLNFPYDELLRTELIHGEVVEMDAPLKRHQLIVVRLCAIFEWHCRDHGGAQAFTDVNLVVSTENALRPDLILILEGQDNPDDPLAFRQPPALAVEVVSDARRDLRLKKELYEQFAVPEYWAVLPDADRIEVYGLTEGAYGKPRIVEPPETVSPSALPGLSVDVSYLLAR